MPVDLCRLLLVECRKLHAQLSADLAMFEQTLVLDYLEDDVPTLTKVKSARLRFDSLSASYQEIEEETGGRDPSSSSTAVPLQADWLKLHWNPSGSPIEFFYNCRTTDTTWDSPTEGRVIDFDSVAQGLISFGEQVASLSEAPRASAPSASAGVSPRGEVVGSPVPKRRLGETISTSSHQANLAFDAHADHGAKRATGTLSLTLMDQSSVKEQYVQSNSASVGATFHPTQPDDEVRVVRKPPGQLPWIIFQRASLSLIVLWALGTAWSILTLWFKIDIVSGWQEGDTLQVPELHPLSFSSPALPPFSRPTGLACHTVAPVALISDRYSVHEVRLDGVGTAGSSQFGQIVNACISDSPALRGGGITDLSVECTEDAITHCTVLVLGTHGSTGVRCDLDRVDGEWFPIQSNGSVVELLGGPWRQVAFRGNDGASWALRSDRLALLRPRSGDALLRPEYSLSHHLVRNLTGLHVVPGHSRLGLRGDGRLFAWPAWGGVALSWRLPRGSWQDLCSTGDSLYVLGSMSAEHPRLWRFPLPSPVLAQRPPQAPRWLQVLLR